MPESIDATSVEAALPLAEVKKTYNRNPLGTNQHQSCRKILTKI